MADQRVLGIDVGGSHVKALVSSDGSERRRFLSGPGLTPGEMVDGVKKITEDWSYDAVSDDTMPETQAASSPSDALWLPKLGTGWVGFDFDDAFGKPTKVVNDAAMQALGSYEGGGTMLFLGLGTGLGSALVIEWILKPMELGHLPFRKATFEDYVGEHGRRQLGKKKWQDAVAETIEHLRAALEPDYVVLGGGNAKKLDAVPPDVRLGANDNAFVGAFRLWSEAPAAG